MNTCHQCGNDVPLSERFIQSLEPFVWVCEPCGLENFKTRHSQEERHQSHKLSSDGSNPSA